MMAKVARTWFVLRYFMATLTFICLTYIPRFFIHGSKFSVDNFLFMDFFVFGTMIIWALGK